ncbi:condensation domain-containing protein [Massilia sp. B-10]|nr:condensation domain-containing protein [Massilia sp. B-10]
MVLAQCCGRDDVVFGTVLSGRLQGFEGADRVVGMFINTLPLRLTLGERSVADAVAEAFNDITELLTHEQSPLALAQRCSGVPRASVPLFSTLFNYRYSHVGTFGCRARRHRGAASISRRSKTVPTILSRCRSTTWVRHSD